MSHGIQHLLGPVFVARMNNDDPESVRLALHLHTFGIIYVQVYAEGRWKLRWRVREPVNRQAATMPGIVDDAVHPDAVEQ